MTTSSLNQTEKRNPSQDDLEKLNNILSELSELDPSSMNDEELVKHIAQKQHFSHIPFHCIIVRFGNLKESINPYSHKPNLKIEVTTTHLSGLKNVSELIYSATDNNGNELVSKVIYPWYFVTITFGGEYWDYINKSNIESLLVGKEFLLLCSLKGKNKYGKSVQTWQMVMLKDDIRTSASIMREYMLKAYRWSVVSLLDNSKEYFDIELTKEIQDTTIRPLLKAVDAIIDKEKSQFIKKEDNPHYKWQKELKRKRSQTEYEQYLYGDFVTE